MRRTGLRSQRVGLLGLLGIVTAAAACYALAFAPKLPDTDASVYLVTAKALASGMGYCRANLLGCPPETYYPPGFAIALAPVMALAGQWPTNVPWMMAVPAASALLALPVMHALLRRLSGSVMLALTITLAVALNYVGAWFTFVPMTETLYTLCTLLALACLLGPAKDGTHTQASEIHATSNATRDDKATLRYLVLGGVLAGLTFWVRSVGLALFGAAILSLALQRRWRAALIVVAAGLPWMASLLVRTYLISNSPEWAPYRGVLINSYLDTFLQRHWQDTTLGRATTADLLQRVLVNVRGHATETLPKLLFPTLESTRLTRPLAALGLAWVIPLLGWTVAGLAVSGWMLRLRRSVFSSDGVVEWYVLLYLGIILLPGWYTFRNVLPILVFVYLYVAWALLWLGRKLARVHMGRKTRVAAALLPALFILLSLGSNLLSQAGTNFEMGAAYRTGGDAYIEEPSFAEVCNWVSTQTPADALFASSSSDKLYLCSGRQSPPSLSTMPVSLNARDHDAVAQTIRAEADYVIINTEDRPQPLTAGEPLGWGSTHFLHSYIYGDPLHFVLRYETFAPPRLRVYEVRK